MVYQVSTNHYQSDNFESSVHHARTSSRRSPSMSYSRPSSSGSTASSTSPFLPSRITGQFSPIIGKDDYRYSKLSNDSPNLGSNVGGRFKVKQSRRKRVTFVYLFSLVTFILFIFLIFKTYSSDGETSSSSSETLKKLLKSNVPWSNVKAEPERPEAILDSTWQFASKIDIVYTWVNGSDPNYQKLRSAYGGAKSVGSGRDRDNDDLKYSLRTVAEFLPWSKGKIYIVSPSPPEWLDLSHPRIQWIDQDSLVPKENQPTFSSNSIEPYLHLIPNLTETFILFNDDNFINKFVHPSAFFTKDRGIKLFFEPHVIRDEIETEDQKGGVRNDRSGKDVDTKKMIKTKSKPTGNVWLTSVRNTKRAITRAYGDENGKLEKELRFLKHAPFVMSKKAYFGMHARFENALRHATSHKFRSREDVITPLLHHAYIQYEGSYCCGIQYEVLETEEAVRTMALVIWTSDSDLNERVLKELKSKDSDLSFFTMNDSMGNDKFGNSRIAQERLKRFYKEKFGGLKGVFEKKA